MTKYFFDLYDEMITRDEEGSELENIPAARNLAIEYVQALVAHRARAGSMNLTHFIKVRDESGKALFAVRFDEAVKIDN